MIGMPNTPERIISTEQFTDMKDRAAAFVSSNYYDAISGQLAEMDIHICN